MERLVFVYTGKYEREWGRKPKGYGFWAFTVEKEPEPRWFSGPYGEAVRWVKKEARKAYPKKPVIRIDVET